MNPSATTVPHVYTLTGNLLAERTLAFPNWSPGRTQRAREETFQVGGKGINVSKMLTRLGAANTALCFTGGAPGAECESWLRARGVSFVAFDTGRPTRVGTVVRDDGATHAETTFLGPDVPASAAAVQACAAFLDQLPAGQVLAVCGSVPGWTTPAFAPLRAALARWSERGWLVADTYGAPLAELVTGRLALLKINADELRTLPGGGSSPLPRTIERVIISDGPRSVQVRDEHGAHATLIPPPIREVSATGSGDVLLACVVQAHFVRKLPLKDAVAFAIPYAAANAAHPGIAEFSDPIPTP
ncbi:PfkB family carbohydrate kinase [Horticoccus sp. 23ND18S-11]|uniref:PfkB family carbohydrate kinase n=1 Tax=Horticoccus sp. 23ND18S-11 TaxID=3391832 RepID=UPI0039C97342